MTINVLGSAYPTKIITKTIEEGLDFILLHFEEPIWPRKISTRATQEGQRLANNRREALAYYKASNYFDCKIAAYPNYTEFYTQRTGIAPSVLLADMDKSRFATPYQFELSAVKTYSNFEKLLGAHPTQLWSGGGYHFLQPQRAIVLETIDVFAAFAEPSRRFMHFEERLMTDNMADPNHYHNVSFYNCMLRVPGSYNSKYIRFTDKGEVIGNIPTESEVRILRRWDGVRPSIKPILNDFWINLIQERNNDALQTMHVENRYHRSNNHPRVALINWIEKLLRIPLDNFRKYCIWRIFVPYLINIKGLAQPDAFKIIKSWLDKCNSVRNLDFNARQKINEAFHRVMNYRNISLNNLKKENTDLYNLLQAKGVI